MRRMTERVLSVGLHADHPAARPGQPHQLGQDVSRLRQADQQRSGVDQVERVGRLAAAPGVGTDQLHIVPTPLSGETHGQLDQGRIGVQPNDPPTGADVLDQLLEDAAGAAADVDHVLSWSQRRPLQQDSAHRCQLLGLPL
jgi:hypothetical protein